MQLDLTKVSFSRAGAYLAVTYITKDIWHVWHEWPDIIEDGIYIRTVRGSDGGMQGILLKVEPNSERLQALHVEPGKVTLGDIEMTFDGTDTLRIRGSRPLTLTLPAGLFDEFMVYDENTYYINSPKSNCKLYITRLQGIMLTDDPGLESKDQPKSIRLSGDWEIAVTEFVWVKKEPQFTQCFEDCAIALQSEFEEYLKKIPPVPARYAEAMRQAAYVNWSAQVDPSGLLTERIMLMSKNWMTNIWTWDCAFNAVELCAYDAESAWNNLVNPFRLQHETGMLLDAQNDRRLIDAYTKPPIHGWALHKLRKAGIISREQLLWLYPRLDAWVKSWYEYMDWDHGGMCQYNHGNDSGWDNCTFFKIGAPIEGPELAAYLTLCHMELADAARTLEMPDAAAKHEQDAKNQLNCLIDTCWTGKRFRVTQSGSHREMQNCDSLLAYLPVILGDLLPKDIFDALAEGIAQENRFLTPYGMATESISSQYYIPDGYWMGPIWAPSTMFIVDGLHRGGRTELAKQIARAFCDSCTVNGFAENFDAQTGAGLRDHSYTWTSSVFMTLVRDLLSETEDLVSLN